MTEHITIKKMRNKANAKRLKGKIRSDYIRRDCINRIAARVVYLPADELTKYDHFFLENGLWSIYDFCGR